MLDQTLAKIFGTRNEREVKKMRPAVAAINDWEPKLQPLSDEALAAKTVEFKQRLANGEPLDDLMIEAYAVTREVGRRVLNMRHFDVQMIGGMVLHSGKIAEMRTGEGKTLVATLPVYLNALGGQGVHVVTVNDYLAKRDAEWMGRIYKFLGMSVGIIVHDLDDDERRQSYGCDITYGTNNEYGFDYLRDNMKFRIADCVQRQIPSFYFSDSKLGSQLRTYNYAIVDEVDSILIDEARTPLIISGPSEESTDKYYKINRIIPKLVRGEEIKGKEPGESYTTGDYTVDEKHRSAALTEEGIGKVEKLLGCGNLYQPENWSIAASRPAGAQSPRAVPSRQGLPGAGRAGDHRRRVHRPRDAGPPLERRSAPGHRGQGSGEDRARESDARHHHVPELLPHVQEAGRHDRYGGNGSR